MTLQTRLLGTLLGGLLAFAPVANASASPAASQTATPSSSPPTKTRPEGHGLVVSGVVLVSASLAAYVATAVGLAIGSRAEADLLPLRDADDIEARQDVLARGQLGNRLAIGAGVTAVALMAAGIPMIVIGRRRAAADQPHAAVTALPMRRGGGASLTLRF